MSALRASTRHCPSSVEIRRNSVSGLPAIRPSPIRAVSELRLPRGPMAIRWLYGGGLMTVRWWFDGRPSDFDPMVLRWRSDDSDGGPMALRRPGDAADLTRRGAGNRVSLRLGKWRAPTLADWPRVVLINGTPGRPVRLSDMVQVLSRPEPTRADRPGLLPFIGGRSDELWRWNSFKGRAAAGQSTNTVRGVAIGPQSEPGEELSFGGAVVRCT